MDEITNRIVQIFDSGLKLSWPVVTTLINKEFETNFTRSAVNHRYLRAKGTERRAEATHRFPLRYSETTPVDLPGNKLIIADTHFPFSHPLYFDFLRRVRDKYQCDGIIHIGDVVDANAVSMWGLDPDGLSGGTEHLNASSDLEVYYAEFPDVLVCIGNHDGRHLKKAFKAGIAEAYLRNYEETWDAPTGWKWGLSWEIDGVIYEHGIGSSGKNAAINRAIDAGQSLVQGHVHYYPAVHFQYNRNSVIFGMNVGCGLDARKFAFAYAKPFRKTPGLGCGVVLNDGALPHFIPMFS